MTENELSAIVRIRRERAEYFGKNLFSDPAWDILLELLAARLGGRRAALPDLENIAPASTVHRWVVALEERGLVIRETNPPHADQIYIDLTAHCMKIMTTFLRRVNETSRLIL